VYCGKTIWPRNEEGLETLARYIIRASFSQERMTYIAVDDSADGTAEVLYESKDGKAIKTFDALDLLNNDLSLLKYLPGSGHKEIISLSTGTTFPVFISINTLVVV